MASFEHLLRRRDDSRKLVDGITELVLDVADAGVVSALDRMTLRIANMHTIILDGLQKVSHCLLGLMSIVDFSPSRRLGPAILSRFIVCDEKLRSPRIKRNVLKSPNRRSETIVPAMFEAPALRKH